jgi:hypothetical protein
MIAPPDFARLARTIPHRTAISRIINLTAHLVRYILCTSPPVKASFSVMLNALRKFAVAILLVVPPIVLLSAAGCNQSGPGRRSVPAVDAPPTVVGNDACRPCHRDIFEQHNRSRHMSTLTAVHATADSGVSPPAGPISGTDYRIERKAGGLYMSSNEHADVGRRIDLAIGSGKFGLSYLSVATDGMERLRMSYLPPHRQWFVHPGDQHADLYDPPGKFPVEKSRECLSCHTTSQPPTGFLPEEKFFGVGCESCHGPGSAHVEAARQKRADLQIEKIGSWGATRINEMCGRCHAKEQAFGEALSDPKETRRFATNALMQSRCFLQSGDSLSCITCHDSHTNASSDRQSYDRICLKCHASPPPTTVLARGNPCPKNPVSSCTSCHMPAGKFEPGLDLPTLMTDHYIRPPSTMHRVAQ